jgi:hypothetical protein
MGSCWGWANACRWRSRPGPSRPWRFGCGASNAQKLDGGTGGKSGGAGGGGGQGGFGGPEAGADVPIDIGVDGPAPADAPEEDRPLETPKEDGPADVSAEMSAEGGASEVPVETITDVTPSTDAGDASDRASRNVCGCVPVGDPCSTNLPCCGGLGCSSGTCGAGNTCLANGSAVDPNRPCCSGSQSGGFCVGPAVCHPQGTSCVDQLNCCSGSGCWNGVCQCVPTNTVPGLFPPNYEPRFCGPAMPCCDPNAFCNGNACVPQSDAGVYRPPHEPPACMPTGGLCDSAHPCCSGVPCCGGFCGAQCVTATGHCDDLHACCRGTCVNGTCQMYQTLDEPLGCDRLSGDACDASDVCCDGVCSNGFCHRPLYSDNGEPCTLGPRWCDDAQNMTCIAGVCRYVVGCFLSGYQIFDPLLVPGCCSGGGNGTFCE